MDHAPGPLTFDAYAALFVERYLKARGKASWSSFTFTEKTRSALKQIIGPAFPLTHLEDECRLYLLMKTHGTEQEARQLLRNKRRALQRFQEQLRAFRAALQSVPRDELAIESLCPTLDVDLRRLSSFVKSALKRVSSKRSVLREFLEAAVVEILEAADVKLTIYRDGRLAQALDLVFMAVGEPTPEDWYPHLARIVRARRYAEALRNGSVTPYHRAELGGGRAVVVEEVDADPDLCDCCGPKGRAARDDQRGRE